MGPRSPLPACYLRWGIPSWYAGEMMEVHLFGGELLSGRFKDILEGCIRLALSDEECLFIPQERIQYVRVNGEKQDGE
jgi:hypothetical protein